MTSMNDTTTLLCLFHHDGQARAALKDLHGAGVPDSAISLFGKEDGRGSSSSALEMLGIAERDLQHLQDAIADGGTILAVAASTEHVETVERIFSRHEATKMDEEAGREEDREAETADGPVSALAGAGGGTREPESAEEFSAQRSVPVIDESLQVGKRTVDQGGVRIYRRVIEIPVEASIKLREEHVIVERNAVDRPATEMDLEGQGNRSIELTETAEEAVIWKSARVVEEVMVGKETGEHIEHVHETVRRTEVEVEELAPFNRHTTAKGA